MSRISWFGSSESVLRPRKDNGKEKELGTSDRHSRAKEDAEHSRSINHSRHHRPRRKEGDRVTIIVEEGARGEKHRRRSTTDVSSSRDMHKSTRPQPIKAESARDVKKSVRCEHGDGYEKEKVKGPFAGEARASASSARRERPRQPQHKDAAQPHRSDTMRKTSKPERPPLVRTNATDPHGRKLSHKSPPVSYNSARVEQTSSSKTSSSLPHRSSTTKNMPSSRHDEGKKTTATSSRMASASKPTRPPLHNERRTTISDTQRASSHRHPEVPRRHSTLSSLPSKSHDKHAASSSTRPHRPPLPKPERKAECLTCCDEVPLSRITKLPCSHKLCNTCMRRLFKMSLTDPQQMPPRCCDPTTPIDPLLVEKLFDRPFRREWNRKYLEYTTANRIYCPKKSCGRWIKPERVKRDWTTGRKYGECSKCHTKACVLCSGKFHPASKECPKDDALKDFMKLGEKEGWRQCYSCKAMVELKYGCNHMTCRCGAEFCMVCAAKWKTCECTLFSDAAIQQDREAHEHDPHAGIHIHNFADDDGPDAFMEFFARGMPGGWGGGGWDGGWVDDDDPPEIHHMRANVDPANPYDDVWVYEADPPPYQDPHPFHHNDNDAPFNGNPQHHNANHNNLANEIEAAFDAFDFQHPTHPAGWRTDFINRANTVLRAPVTEQGGREAEGLVRELRGRARAQGGGRVGGERDPPLRPAERPQRARPQNRARRAASPAEQQGRGHRPNVMDFLEDGLAPDDGNGDGDGEGDDVADAARARRERRRRASLMAGVEGGQRGEGRVREWRRFVS